MGGAVISHDTTSDEKIIKYEVLEALNKIHATNKYTDHVLTLDRIILKFDRLHAVVKSAKRAFASFANDDGVLTPEKLVEAIRSIHPNVVESHIQTIFNVSDVDVSRTIDFREFITALTIALAIHELPSSTETTDGVDESFTELREMLELLLSAYCMFDTESKGYLERSHVDKVLAEYAPKCHSHIFGQVFLSADRWDEMHWSSNHHVKFEDFICTVAGWIIEVDDSFKPRELKKEGSMEKFESSLQKALLKQRDLELAHSPKFVSFERVLLKFDNMHFVLKAARQSFNKYSEPDDTLTSDGLIRAIQHIHPSSSPEHIKKIYEFSDVDTSRRIDFKEFIAALTVAMTMDDLPPTIDANPETVEQYQNLREMLAVILSAYLSFDRDCKGYIEKDIVDSMILEHGGHYGKHALGQKMLSEQRWGEMDWDGNGHVDFAEFVCTFASWAIDIDDTLVEESKSFTLPTLSSNADDLLKKKEAENGNGEEEEEESESQKELRHDMLSALRRTKKENDKLDKPMTLEKVLMKSDKIANIFRTTKSSFDEYATDKVLSKDSLVKAVQKIYHTISAERIKRIFDLSDVDESRFIDFKEFLTSLTIASILDELKPDNAHISTKEYDDLKECYRLVACAYLVFDKNVTGEFSKDTPHDSDGSFLNEDRWNEMDWDGNGNVDFPEFACTFMGWILTDEDEDEENQ